jgi:hypothetical protein
MLVFVVSGDVAVKSVEPVSGCGAPAVAFYDPGGVNCRVVPDLELAVFLQKLMDGLLKRCPVVICAHHRRPRKVVWKAHGAAADKCQTRSICPYTAYLTNPIKNRGFGKQASDLFWYRSVSHLCAKTENRMLFRPVYTENENPHLRGNTLFKEMMYESDGLKDIW